MTSWRSQVRVLYRPLKDLPPAEAGGFFFLDVSGEYDVPRTAYCDPRFRHRRCDAAQAAPGFASDNPVIRRPWSAASVPVQTERKARSTALQFRPHPSPAARYGRRSTGCPRRQTIVTESCPPAGRPLRSVDSIHISVYNLCLHSTCFTGRCSRRIERARSSIG